MRERNVIVVNFFRLPSGRFMGQEVLGGGGESDAVVKIIKRARVKKSKKSKEEASALKDAAA